MHLEGTLRPRPWGTVQTQWTQWDLWTWIKRVHHPLPNTRCARWAHSSQSRRSSWCATTSCSHDWPRSRSKTKRWGPMLVFFLSALCRSFGCQSITLQSKSFKHVLQDTKMVSRKDFDQSHWLHICSLPGEILNVPITENIAHLFESHVSQLFSDSWVNGCLMRAGLRKLDHLDH